MIVLFYCCYQYYVNSLKFSHRAGTSETCCCKKARLTERTTIPFGRGEYEIVGVWSCSFQPEKSIFMSGPGFTWPEMGWESHPWALMITAYSWRVWLGAVPITKQCPALLLGKHVLSVCSSTGRQHALHGCTTFVLLCQTLRWGSTGATRVLPPTTLAVGQKLQPREREKALAGNRFLCPRKMRPGMSASSLP